jgi:hypothetical protein
MLVCVLRGMGSQLELWRLLASKGLWEYPRFEITDQAIYNRLAREGTDPLQRLFGQVSALLKERLKPYELRGPAGFAEEVVALDQSTLEKVARMLPALKEVNPKELVAGKIAGLFDVRPAVAARNAHRRGQREREGLSQGDDLGACARGDGAL